MNQKVKKPLTDFTEKQRKAYKSVMKAAAELPLEIDQVYKVIRKADIYEKPRDIKEASKMLIKNPNTPLKTSNSKVINELAVNEK